MHTAVPKMARATCLTFSGSLVVSTSMENKDIQKHKQMKLVVKHVQTLKSIFYCPVNPIALCSIEIVMACFGYPKSITT